MITEIKVSNCQNCPLTEYYSEQGFSYIVCRYIPYGIIPDKGILNKCPLKDKPIQIILKEQN